MDAAPARARGAVRRAAPRAFGLSRRWRIVGALSVTETISYGVLQYAFPVFLVPMGAELGWSAAAMTGAFSAAALVSGAAAVPAGRWVDRHGARGLMTAGSVLAAALLWAWSAVDTLAGLYAVWLGLGVAMAAVLYEPAFAVVAAWFTEGRGKALTVLTFVAGFASVIFVPLADRLVAAHGWRDALVWLAAIVLLGTAVPHALVLRRAPSPSTPREVASASGDGVAARSAVRTASFRWLAASFALSALATTAAAVHLIPLLVGRGHSPAFAASVLGAVGLAALPGRLVFTPLGERISRPAVTATIFLLQAGGAAALLLGSGDAAAWAFVVLFGAGFGAVTPARAALLADFYGAAGYGAIGGVLALALALSRAAAPVGGSLFAAAAGYDAVLVALAATCLASAAAVLLAGRARTRELHRTASP